MEYNLYLIPKKAISPMRIEYRQELDFTEYIGTLRWLIEIGRVDLSHSVQL